MKIAIIGAGAMGCLYGGKLSEGNNQVFLLDIWKDHVDAINRDGLIIEWDGVPRYYKNIRATTQASDVGIVDLAIIFVKSTMTSAAVKDNKSVFGPETVALTLQNGMGNIDLIAGEIGARQVVAGTTAHGATMLSPGRIRHTGTGVTMIGEPEGEETERIVKIAAALKEAGLETRISNNVLGMIWDKLLVNVGINALTSITGLLNGQLLDYEELNELMEMAVTEGETVAKAKGIKLSYDAVGHCRDVAKATATNKSSMLQDILNGKQTEIDMINGAIVREGTALGISTPINIALTKLIKFKQRQKTNS